MEHNQLIEVLRRAGSDSSASELHGSLCGRICTSGERALQPWLDEAFEGADRANAAVAEARRRLTEVFARQWRDLEAREFSFEMLLPGDDMALQERTEALALWCQGFLHGLACGGLPGADELESRYGARHVVEVIEDFSEIGRATYSDDDPDPHEDAERAFTELVEFVRVGVQMSFEELAALRESGSDASRLHS